MIFDGEQLTDLMEPLDLGWRERRERELALMADLVPLLNKLAHMAGTSRASTLTSIKASGEMTANVSLSRAAKRRFPEFMGQPLHHVRLRDLTEESTARNGSRLSAETVMGVKKEDGIVRDGGTIGRCGHLPVQARPQQLVRLQPDAPEHWLYRTMAGRKRCSRESGLRRIPLP